MHIKHKFKQAEGWIIHRVFWEFATDTCKEHLSIEMKHDFADMTTTAASPGLFLSPPVPEGPRGLDNS